MPTSFLRTLLALAVLVAAFAKPMAASPPDDDHDDTRTVQVVRLSGAYADHSAGPSFDPIDLIMGGGAKTRSFYGLCDQLEEIATDPNVDAIFFDLSAVSIGMNQAQYTELARHLQKLRAAGKKTYAWLENGSTTHAVIASTCDEVLMADFAGLDFPSLSMTSMHFRDAMDLLGIRAEVVRVGDFKGAVEPFTLSRMSKHLREHYLSMITSMNDALVGLVARGRGLEVGAVRALQAERLLMAEACRKAGLVDHLVPYGEERQSVARLMGGTVLWKDDADSKKSPSFFEVLQDLMGKKDSGPRGDYLAVLHLTGGIVDGQKDAAGSMVSGPTVRQIRALAKDRKVQGVVVRINSPGGSATASEAIREALEDLAQKKPLVLSMGNVAASGGYWITCIGRPIYCEAGTITGSIGVFGLKMNFGPLLDRVGIHVESIALDSSAAAMAPNEPWDDAMRDRIQAHIDDTYRRFLGLVARSRRMPVPDVDAIAGGRVWSGNQAKKLGLIDEVGGLDDALAALTRQIGREDLEVVHRPKAKSLFESLDLLGGGARASQLGLEPAALAWAHRLGFRLDGPLQMLLNPQPTVVWAFAPTELVIQ